MSLRAGDWVEVRSKEEILATLDAEGRLDQLPFMPEMFRHCGQRFEVMARAHKTCDTVNRTGGRRLEATVHLKELRCDGAAHDGCEAACLILWQEVWLKRAGEPASASATGGCTEAQVQAATRATGDSDGAPRYRCQATLLPQFTTPLKWWDLRQYVEDYTSRNVGLRRLVNGAVYVFWYGLIKRVEPLSSTLAYRLIQIYDAFQKLAGGPPYPRLRGSVPAGVQTPSRPLNLKAGELVRVRPYAEILTTLDRTNKNRGMYFDAEEVPHCGKVFRVRSPVRRIVDERSGAMLEFKEQSVILDGAWCEGRYSDRRMQCPRAIFPFWKETWLERVEAPAERTDRPQA